MPIISVLFSVALLSVTVTSLLFTAHVSYGLVQNASQIAQATTITEAATNHAILDLIDPTNKQSIADGVAREFNINTFHVRVRVQDELGRIDINHCDDSSLINLFRSAGLQEQAARNLVYKIIEWRGTHPAQRINEIKEIEDRNSGFRYRLRNGPFQSIDELMLVKGMTPDLFRRIKPAVTVYSGHKFVDPQLAPREVLVTFPNMNDEKINAFISTRSQQNAHLFNDGASHASINPINALRGRAFTIQAELITSNNVFVSEATIRLTGIPSNPYWVLNWQRN